MASPETPQPSVWGSATQRGAAAGRLASILSAIRRAICPAQRLVGMISRMRFAAAAGSLNSGGNGAHWLLIQATGRKSNRVAGFPMAR